MGAAEFLRRLDQGKPAVLTALGDSLTVGYMLPLGYLDMTCTALRQRFPGADLEVRNHGVCGDTVFDGARRAGRALLGDPPHLAFIQFGLNDAFSGVTPFQFRRGLFELVTQVQQAAPDTELLLVPPPRVRYLEFDREAEPFRGAMEDTARTTGVLVAPMARVWDAHQGSEPLWLGDGVHPSLAGYGLMAEAVLEAVLD